MDVDECAAPRRDPLARCHVHLFVRTAGAACSLAWLTFGLRLGERSSPRVRLAVPTGRASRAGNVYIWFPNAVGLAMAVLQLSLFAVFSSNKPQLP